MRVIQLLPKLSMGDAIGNDVLLIDETLRENGYESLIMSPNVQEELRPRTAEMNLSLIRPDDLILFHKSTGDGLLKRVAALPCRKGMIYHNMTPPGFFLPYDPVVTWNLVRGRRQLKKYARQMDFSWGDSEYNCRELRKAGAKNVSLRPVLFEPGCKAEPDPAVLNRLQETRGTKILFIGRVVPNKKQEDLIKAYYTFLHSADPEAQLYLIGGWEGMEKYYAKLKGFCADLRLRDDQVVFTGKVSETEKEAYLRAADIFLCMSAHEGFCVPLLEAGEHDLPVIAYAVAAVPETLGDNGLLVRTKDYAALAALMNRVCTDRDLRKAAVEKQRESRKRFEKSVVRARVLDLLHKALENDQA